MNCNRTDCIHYKVCEEWKLLDNDNYINDSYGNCDYYATTVEHSLLPLASELDSTYMRGYEVGKAEGILKASTRPKGEWIYDYPLPEDDCGAYMCSVCQIGDFDIRGNENFCPHCGADMRGGKEE